MVKDAESHADEDKSAREVVEAKNAADGLVHTTESALKEHGDNLSVDEKSAIESDLAALKEAMEGEDAEAIKEKTQTLAQSSMKLGEAMYKAQQERKARKPLAATTTPALPRMTMLSMPTSRKSTTARKTNPKALG